MTEREALAVLGLPGTAGESEIKKRYRQLMQKLHPDADPEGQASYPYPVQEVNLAYRVLVRRGTGDREEEEIFDEGIWPAPVNPGSYCRREILQQVEDPEGNVIGVITFASGRYFWTEDEEFFLFQRSIYRCACGLLDEVLAEEPDREEPKDKLRYLGELTYLLAVQFISERETLPRLSRQQGEIYRMEAMAELKDKGMGRLLKEGEVLVPAAMRHHRLILARTDGQEVGYLSFADDRLYYVVIPILEQRRGQVRIRVEEGKTSEDGRKNYRRLTLELRFAEAGNPPADLNGKIRRILDRYREACCRRE